MRVWRICRKPYVVNALDGIGGMYTSGRRHTEGGPVVYTASSAALAALEVLDHVDPLTTPTDLRLLAIEIPDGLSMEALERCQLRRRSRHSGGLREEAFSFDTRLF